MYIFLIPASMAEVAAVIPIEGKIVFARETSTFINGPANLLNNEPINHSYQIILDI